MKNSFSKQDPETGFRHHADEHSHCRHLCVPWDHVWTIFQLLGRWSNWELACPYLSMQQWLWLLAIWRVSQDRRKSTEKHRLLLNSQIHIRRFIISSRYCTVLESVTTARTGPCGGITAQPGSWAYCPTAQPPHRRLESMRSFVTGRAIFLPSIFKRKKPLKPNSSCWGPAHKQAEVQSTPTVCLSILHQTNPHAVTQTAHPPSHGSVHALLP